MLEAYIFATRTKFKVFKPISVDLNSLVSEMPSASSHGRLNYKIIDFTRRAPNDDVKKLVKSLADFVTEIDSEETRKHFFLIPSRFPKLKSIYS